MGDQARADEETGTRRRARRMLRVERGRAALLASLLACVSFAAEAEIYECTDASGKTVFTTEPGKCPGAEPRDFKAEVQKVDSSHAAVASPAKPAQHAPAGVVDPEAADGIEEMWRRKKSNAESELEQATEYLGRLETLVAGCSRGASWLQEDESGLRKQISCDEIRSEHARVERRQKELTSYLEGGGLREECRKAGCLPGWIR